MTSDCCIDLDMVGESNTNADIIQRQVTRSKSYEILDVQFEVNATSPWHQLWSSASVAQFPLYKYNEIPVFLKGNPYVMGSYRVHLNGVECIKSIFHWTNETINIWSHLLGFFIFFFLTFIDNLIMIPRYKGDMTDHIVVTIGLVCFQFCMLCSAGYHTFVCHSEKACRKWLTIDLAGICVGLVGCYVPAVHFAFYCLSIWRDVYMISVFFLTCCVLLVQLYPRFGSTEFWRLRILIYMGLAGFGVIPTSHWVYLNGGFNVEIVQLFFFKIVIVYSLGLLALLFYLKKIPENIFPGKVDVIGHSHQLWHLIVLIAFLYWHFAGTSFLRYRTSQHCV